MRVDNDIKSSRRCPCGEAKDLKKLSRVSNDARRAPKMKNQKDTPTRLAGVGRSAFDHKTTKFLLPN